MQIELSEIMLQRSVVSCGNAAYMNRFLHKLQNGSHITYCAIGGSITEGAAASSPPKNYASRFSEWLGVKTHCRFINAGIGATTSMYGAYRAEQDILFASPDLITIEFAVNDIRNPDTAGSFENLVRQCVNQPQKPLVILIFTLWRNGHNLQDVHIPIGKHYGLPMLSYRDAIFPEIQAGRILWEDISPDDVHPNDEGPRLIADILIKFIEFAGKIMSSASTTAEVQYISEPLHPSAEYFEGGRVCDALKMQVATSSGWTLQKHDKRHTGWRADTPGACMEFDVTCRTLIIGYRKYAGNFGKIAVRIDNCNQTKIIDGHFEKDPVRDWAGGHTMLEILFVSNQQATHHVEIILLENTEHHSKGELFEIGYFLLS